MKNKNLILTVLVRARIFIWPYSLKLTVCVILIALCFFLINQHVTLALVQLEILTLISRLLITMYLSSFSSSITFIITLLIVGVLEGTAGLSLLALSSRAYRAELFKFHL